MRKSVLMLHAILVAPYAVFLKVGWGRALAINLFLCLLLYIPAVVHAIWIVRK
jgi:uncharacterized membrane protein YqaE (UPF0057 family)